MTVLGAFERARAGPSRPPRNRATGKPQTFANSGRDGIGATRLLLVRTYYGHPYVHHWDESGELLAAYGPASAGLHRAGPRRSRRGRHSSGSPRGGRAARTDGDNPSAAAAPHRDDTDRGAYAASATDRARATAGHGRSPLAEAASAAGQAAAAAGQAAAAASASGQAPFAAGRAASGFPRAGEAAARTKSGRAARKAATAGDFHPCCACRGEEAGRPVRSCSSGVVELDDVIDRPAGVSCLWCVLFADLLVLALPHLERQQQAAGESSPAEAQELSKPLRQPRPEARRDSDLVPALPFGTGRDRHQRARPEL